MLTKSEWMTKVKENRDKLRSLLANFHPNSRADKMNRPALPITATTPEMARLNIVGTIKTEKPLELFDRAVDTNDVRTVDKLLNEAWFGVPESTSCWDVEGFSEAVALMEDLPEDE